jgi:hypothetical protein
MSKRNARPRAVSNKKVAVEIPSIKKKILKEKISTLQKLLQTEKEQLLTQNHPSINILRVCPGFKLLKRKLHRRSFRTAPESEKTKKSEELKLMFDEEIVSDDSFSESLEEFSDCSDEEGVYPLIDDHFIKGRGFIVKEEYTAEITKSLNFEKGISSATSTTASSVTLGEEGSVSPYDFSNFKGITILNLSEITKSKEEIYEVEKNLKSMNKEIVKMNRKEIIEEYPEAFLSFLEKKLGYGNLVKDN